MIVLPGNIFPAGNNFETDQIKWSSPPMMPLQTTPVIRAKTISSVQQSALRCDPVKILIVTAFFMVTYRSMLAEHPE
jgi:predicted RND superfamily exporter protein